MCFVWAGARACAAPISAFAVAAACAVACATPAGAIPASGSASCGGSRSPSQARARVLATQHRIVATVEPAVVLEERVGRAIGGYLEWL